MSDELVKRLRRRADNIDLDFPVFACLLREASDELEKARAAVVPEDMRPDCGTCANRGRVDGLSQETHCEHCCWQESWRTDHYAPKGEQA